MGNVLASMAAYVASQECLSISRWNKGGLDDAKSKRKELGRPQCLTNEQLTAVRQDLAGETPAPAMDRKYGMPRSTLRGALDRAD